jgi:hypothetical protein
LFFVQIIMDQRMQASTTILHGLNTSKQIPSSLE